MKFDINTAIVRDFIGGQLEAQNWREGYVFGGEIADAYVQDNILTLILAWSAIGRNFPLVKELVSDDRRDYTASLDTFEASPGDCGVICLDARKTLGEITRLFPKNRRQIDPSQVEGLVLGTRG